MIKLITSNNVRRLLCLLLLISIPLILSVSFYFFWLYPRYTVPILTYHDFGYVGIQVTPENFERQMRFLKDNYYNVISLDELAKGIKRGKGFAHNTVVITFDDGYQDNYTCAYPLLKKYGFPATIFLIANNIGIDKKFLNWGEVKEMTRNDISFGGHTKNHVYLPEITNKDVLWDEISGCKKIIEEHSGKPVEFFSYPKGGFTQEIKVLLKKAGYKAACTTNRGLDVLDREDVYELNRISVRKCDTSFNLWAKLSGYYNLFRKRREGD